MQGIESINNPSSLGTVPEMLARAESSLPPGIAQVEVTLYERPGVAKESRVRFPFFTTQYLLVSRRGIVLPTKKVTFFQIKCFFEWRLCCQIREEIVGVRPQR